MEFQRKLYMTVEEICQGDRVQLMSKLGPCLDQVRTKKKNKNKKRNEEIKNRKIKQEQQISTKYNKTKWLLH